MASYADRVDIAQFEWKYDDAPPGTGHIFHGIDPHSGYEKVWLENWKDGTKHGKCSFRMDELPEVIAGLQKALKQSKSRLR